MPLDEPETFELVGVPKMNRIKRLFEAPPAYEPINGESAEDAVEDDDTSIGAAGDDDQAPFSWLEYGIFFLLGIAMLWAWNMFLAAAPYFQHRFRKDNWILNHFQAAEISVSTFTNLIAMIVLSKLQENASYPRRISMSLFINITTFAILALSTLVEASAGVYFGFLLITIFVASLATALIQNGLFAFSSGFGRSEYTQAIMTGQAVAGVMPPLTQIISVAVVSSHKKGSNAHEASASPTSAFVYFLTATVVSVIALLAFFYLLRRKSQSDALKSARKSRTNGTSEGDALMHSTGSIAARASDRHSVPLLTLFRKLPFLSLGVFACFTVTMIGFPVFTASIFSIGDRIDSAIFIPLAFFVWNVGDLAGRLITLSPKVSLVHWPFALFCIAMARLLFVPMYLLCNVKGRGAVVNSDVFYLLIVQGLYGLTNGYVGSECMMGASEWVLPEEREAAGGYMGLMLVAGLTVGSLLSFTLGDV